MMREEYDFAKAKRIKKKIFEGENRSMKGSVKTFVSLEINGSFLVRITI